MEASSDLVANLLEVADRFNVAYDVYEGVLLDSYILYGADIFNVGGQKCAKYIIAKERFINEWTSGYTLVFTDSIEDVLQFKESISN